MSNTFEYIYCKKIKINPSINQKETFDFWFRKCKYLYNTALEEKIEYYKKTGKYLNLYDQKKELVDIKDYDSTWKDVPNKSLSEIIFRVDKSFKSFFRGGGFPKFKSDLNTVEFVKTDVRIKDKLAFLPKIKSGIKGTEDFPEDYTSVKLTKQNNKFYLIFTIKSVVNSIPTNKDILGIDLGLKDLYTDSNGNKCLRFSQKLIKKYLGRIKLINKSLITKKKGSIKFKKVKKNLNKAHQRLKNTRNDYLHKKSKELLECNEYFISLGDINIKSILKGEKTEKGIIKSFYVNSIGHFKQYVLNKSIRMNRQVILVNEKNTSKTCSCCGNIKYDLKLSDRIYSCLKCVNSIDRDYNSAINMKMLGSSILSEDRIVSKPNGDEIEISVHI
jgi:putative transposase